MINLLSPQEVLGNDSAKRDSKWAPFRKSLYLAIASGAISWIIPSLFVLTAPGVRWLNTDGQDTLDTTFDGDEPFLVKEGITLEELIEIDNLRHCRATIDSENEDDIFYEGDYYMNCFCNWPTLPGRVARAPISSTILLRCVGIFFDT